ncbi:olfactory receptor 51B2-like [Manis pentadactyla]|uniref:olfactory receptor 51B2-like n=1 Tax=Manis pentadactyla TaxID=143292 RepID=UPI00255CD2F5|nr:olfactory receptor 51B2-like [Manis pentadactyla]
MLGSNISAASFLLTGFPGLEAAHRWISIPFFAVYVSVLLGNGTLVYLIKDDHSLHEPMYYFLALLAGTDLMVTLTTMPTVMGVLWVNRREISYGACFLQAYFIHSLSIVESGVLLAMAYDRIIAISTPLRYNSILTNSQVMKVGLGALLRGFVSIVPPIVPLYWFPYCHSHVLSHAFCLHQDVMKLACADITFNRVYPVILAALTFFLDALIILFSHVLILKTVRGITSGEERAKALNTCVSHISCVLVFYIMVIGLTFIHRFGKHAPRVVHVTMSYVYFLFPPFMNPIIYSIKTQQIQRGIIRLFSGHSRA